MRTVFRRPDYRLFFIGSAASLGGSCWQGLRLVGPLVGAGIFAVAGGFAVAAVVGGRRRQAASGRLAA